MTDCLVVLLNNLMFNIIPRISLLSYCSIHFVPSQILTVSSLSAGIFTEAFLFFISSVQFHENFTILKIVFQRVSQDQ